MGACLPIQSLFAVLKDRRIDLPWTQQFLAGIAVLPPDIQGELPILTDLAALCTKTNPFANAPIPGREAAAAQEGGPIPRTSALWGPVRRGLNRRYLRIRFVQGELERLDFKKAKPGDSFNDFVFDHIDFAAYKKITEEDFTLFTGEGLADFKASFFAQAFRLNREKTAVLIGGAYTRIGGFYYIKQENLLSNPLLMAMLRTLQTSLAFIPLFTADTVLAEWNALLCFLERRREADTAAFFQGSDLLFASLIRALDGADFVHTDGTRTALAAVQENSALTLRGVFHPHGKAYTVTLT
jgi:hypothetical protein